MKIVVVIPIYKNPDQFELISLCQCFDVLSKYDIALVSPQSFDTTVYRQIGQTKGNTFSEIRFDDKFFENIAGYNRLLLSEIFYKAFVNYDYMLIYQLDAYVFSDQLEYWCNKGYDYIGAPLVGEFKENIYDDTMKLRVGNGGFSLRRIQTFLDFFAWKSNVFDSKQIATRINISKKPYTRVFVWILMMLGWHNRPESLTKCYQYNEDAFWSLELEHSRYSLNKPQPQDALQFALERFPKEMFKKTGKLPFGCHAWQKYEYEEFWSKYIRVVE